MSGSDLNLGSQGADHAPYHRALLRTSSIEFTTVPDGPQLSPSVNSPDGTFTNAVINEPEE